MTTRDRLVIANCGGFWGDDPTAARRQVEGGPIDVLVMDYLAEVTMAILQKQRARRPETGFAADFLTQLRDTLVPCMDRGVTIISNAGGVNPIACGAAVEALAEELGVADKVKVGVVLGDDIFGDLASLTSSGEDLAHMETGRPLTDVLDRALSANVYLGAQPVVAAIRAGANVIVSGRVTDTGVTLAPMIAHFDWAEDDWDRLAAGIVAGHIIECGTQCTGGNFTDWEQVPSFDLMGYPIIEASPDGSFIVTKHPGTGGMVTTHTVSEQLVYEMGAPRYLSPDCIARFDSIQLEQVGPDRVRVTSVRGEPAPEKLKVSISFADGHRAFGRLMVGGPDARRKAEKVAEVLWKSVGGRGAYEATSTQYVGDDSCHPSVTGNAAGEIMLQIGVRDRDAARIRDIFAPQVVPKVLGTVPGITYLADQGRPRASDVVGYWPALIGRDRLSVEVRVGGETQRLSSALPGDRAGDDASTAGGAGAGGAGTSGASGVFTPEAVTETVTPSGDRITVPLIRLCLARSGDKGDTCNVGVIARSPAIYSWMRETLTPDLVKQRFAGICHGGVDRFEVPNLLALNFLLHESLGGGGTLSLLMDAQGKTYAQYLLALDVEVDAALLATVDAGAATATSRP